MEIIFSGSKTFKCLVCGQVFGWHKGSSDLSGPSSCPNCGEDREEALVENNDGLQC